MGSTGGRSSSSGGTRTPFPHLATRLLRLAFACPSRKNGHSLLPHKRAQKQCAPPPHRPPAPTQQTTHTQVDANDRLVHRIKSRRRNLSPVSALGPKSSSPCCYYYCCCTSNPTSLLFHSVLYGSLLSGPSLESDHNYQRRPRQ